MLRLPIKTGIQLVGGPNGAADILIKPPWQGEDIEAVLIFVTAYGNTAANILYVTADSAQLLQGALTLSNPERGAVFVINGAGSLSLAHSPIQVSDYLRVTPAAASNGQIYLGFYWQRLGLQAPQVPLTPPEHSMAAVAHEEMKEENEVWRKVRGRPPREFLKQNPGTLTKEQRERLGLFESMTDMRRNPGREIEP